MKAKTMEQLVGDLRTRAEELDSRAQHLRQTADFLSEEFRLDGDPGEQATDSAPPESTEPKNPSPRSPERKPVMLSCTGCPDKPDCTNKIASPRRRKNAKCEECKRLVNNARLRSLRAKKKAQNDPKLKSVWRGGEGLSSGAPSSLDPNVLPSAGV